MKTTETVLSQKELKDIEGKKFVVNLMLYKTTLDGVDMEFKYVQVDGTGTYNNEFNVVMNPYAVAFIDFKKTKTPDENAAIAFQSIYQAYLGTLARILTNDLEFPEGFIPTDKYKVYVHVDKIRDIKNPEFTWHVSHKIESGMLFSLLNLKDKIYGKKDMDFNYSCSLKNLIKDQPHFDIINRLWKEKTGNNINFFDKSCAFMGDKLTHGSWKGKTRIEA